MWLCGNQAATSPATHCKLKLTFQSCPTSFHRGSRVKLASLCLSRLSIEVPVEPGGVAAHHCIPGCCGRVSGVEPRPAHCLPAIVWAGIVCTGPRLGSTDIPPVGSANTGTAFSLPVRNNLVRHTLYTASNECNVIEIETVQFTSVEAMPVVPVAWLGEREGGRGGVPHQRSRGWRAGRKGRVRAGEAHKPGAGGGGWAAWLG